MEKEKEAVAIKLKELGVEEQLINLKGKNLIINNRIKKIIGIDKISNAKIKLLVKSNGVEYIILNIPLLELVKRRALKIKTDIENIVILFMLFFLFKLIKSLMQN